jgi:hypothetical protein
MPILRFRSVSSVLISGKVSAFFRSPDSPIIRFCPLPRHVSQGIPFWRGFQEFVPDFGDPTRSRRCRRSVAPPPTTSTRIPKHLHDSSPGNTSFHPRLGWDFIIVTAIPLIRHKIMKINGLC